MQPLVTPLGAGLRLDFVPLIKILLSLASLVHLPPYLVHILLSLSARLSQVDSIKSLSEVEINSNYCFPLVHQVISSQKAIKIGQACL